MSRLDATKPTLAPPPGFSSSPIPRLGVSAGPAPDYAIPMARRRIGNTDDNNHARRIEELREAAELTEPCTTQDPKLPAKRRRAEAQDFSRGIVESQDYRMSLRLRAANGTLPPAIEMMLWNYSYGQPRDKMERPTELVRGRVALEGSTTEELAARAGRLQALLTMQAEHDAGNCGPTCSLCIPIDVEVVQ